MGQIGVVDQYRNEMFVTPTKKESVHMRNLNTTNSDYKNYSSESSHRARLLSSPESFFTPLRIPGSSKNDTAEYSKSNLLKLYIELFLMRTQCYCIPEFGNLTINNVYATD